MAGRTGRSTKPAGRSTKPAQPSARRRPGKVGMLGTLLAAAGAAANSSAGRRALSGAKDRASAARARRGSSKTGTDTVDAGGGI